MTKLNILDIDKYIINNKIKEVSSVKRFSNVRGDLDPQGLYSEDIFGRVGSKQRKETFGFINLKVKIINPVSYGIILATHPNFKKYINGTDKFLISEKGELILDENGFTGVYHFIKNFEFINLDIIALSSKHPENIPWIKKNKIFVDKILVLPAGIRDIHENKASGVRVFENSEISNLYEQLLIQTRNIMGDADMIPESILEANTLIIQKTVLKIEDWLKKMFKGKRGILRGGLLAKRVDFSGRENIIPDDYIPLGFVGIPINHVLKFFDPFFVYHVLNVETSLQEDIKNYLNMDRNKKLDASDISKFITNVYNNPNNLIGEFYNKIKRAAEIITRDKVVIYKRDPTESRDTWISAYVRVDDTGYALRINPLDLKKNTGDFDGDAVSVFSLLTEEAQKQAKEFMNPLHSKSTWLRSTTANNLVYNIEGDALIGLNLATEN